MSQSLSHQPLTRTYFLHEPKTLKKLVKRLKKWDVTLYKTDCWDAYSRVLPNAKLIQSKSQTHGIERNNCRNRHWFGRFKRLSIIVSKSKEMVDLTMALFARFRVNGSVEEIFTLGMIPFYNIS